MNLVASQDPLCYICLVSQSFSQEVAWFYGIWNSLSWSTKLVLDLLL